MEQQNSRSAWQGAYQARYGRGATDSSPLRSLDKSNVSIMPSNLDQNPGNAPRAQPTVSYAESSRMGVPSNTTFHQTATRTSVMPKYLDQVAQIQPHGVLARGQSRFAVLRPYLNQQVYPNNASHNRLSSSVFRDAYSHTSVNQYQSQRPHHSILSPNLDQPMASRQCQIDSLPPQQRHEQEQWAQQQLSVVGACVAGFAWGRVGKGYRCCGDDHYVTDKLLAEGRGGYYVREEDTGGPDGGKEMWSGPLYQNSPMILCGLPSQPGSKLGIPSKLAPNSISKVNNDRSSHRGFFRHRRG